MVRTTVGVVSPLHLDTPGPAVALRKRGRYTLKASKVNSKKKTEGVEGVEWS